MAPWGAGVRPERLAVGVIVFLALYAAWTLFTGLEDGRCWVGEGDAGLICTERPPIVLPTDAPDLDRV